VGFFSDYIPRSGDKLLTKWAHYFNAYERELTRYRREPVTFLEIGVFQGGSLPMWKEFFAEGSTLVFVDIDPRCKSHEIPGTVVEIGSQADPDFLSSLAEKYGPFDVVLDDGSHICKHQIATFNHLWRHIKNQGVYIVEDCHTSYWPGFGGGYRNEASFIEFSKRVIDRMHSWYTDQDDLFPFDPISEELHSLRFYDSVVVFEKQTPKPPPTSLTIQNGKVSASRRALEVRNRTSIFAGKDDSGK
jgi:hypothetical protein